MADGVDLVTAFREVVGDDLRAIGWFTVEEYEVVYERDDVESRYSPEDIDDIHREQVFDWLNRAYLEGLFDDVGELRCTTRWFDEIAVFITLPDGDDALFVSVDRTEDLDADAVVARSAELVS
jgi:hypothetical protein